MSNLEILTWSWTLTYLISLPGLWMLFKKLDIIAWYSLIPIFNFIVLMKYFEISRWFLLLMITVPLGLVVVFFVNYKLAKSFGEGFGMAVGLSLWFTKPIFISILGFGKHEFIGKEGLV